MKKVFITIFYVFIANFISAQDIIVTNNGDSINAKITRVTTNFIYFSHMHEGNVRNTLLHKEAVKYYLYNHYAKPELPDSVVNKKKIFSRWRLALHGGFSWRIAKTNPNLSTFEKDYINELKSGNKLGVDLTYFLSESFGLGLQYDYFFSSHSIYASAMTPNGTVVSGELSDKISIAFIGLNLKWRIPSNGDKNTFLIGFAPGYTRYIDEGHFIEDAKIEGNAFGMSYDFDYDIGLSNHTCLTFGLSLKLSNLSSYKFYHDDVVEVITLERDSYESLARVDLSVGISFK